MKLNDLFVSDPTLSHHTHNILCPLSPLKALYLLRNDYILALTS